MHSRKKLQCRHAAVCLRGSCLCMRAGTHGRKTGSTPYGYMLLSSPANSLVRMSEATVLFSMAVGCLEPAQSTSSGENLE